MESSPPVSVPDSDKRIAAELVRQGFFDLPAGLGATVLVAGGLAWVVADSASPQLAWGWFAAMVVFVVWRGATGFIYRRHTPTLRQHRFWRRQFSAGATASALGWGFAAWFFYPLLGVEQLSLLILVVAGVTAGATRSLGSNLTACCVFQTLCMLPLIARMLQGDDASHIIMGTLSVLYTVFLIAMARSYHRNLGQSLRLGFESAALATELQEKQRQTATLNRELSSEVAQRREIETELRAAKERAEAANQAKGDFLATMSHEIRTPMNGVLGMLDLLSSTSLTPAQREQVETAASSADSLQRILNDILDYSKIESGRLDFESIPFRPGVVAEDVVTLLRPRAAAKSLELKLTVDEKCRTRVLGDPMRFRQVLLNLVGNAVKFSERGEAELEVVGDDSTLGLLRLQVRVRDHGIGMDEQTRAQLFQPFKQADSSMSRRYGGSGLGLAISQRLVQYMGGEITAQSELGRGSVFEFTVNLPLARERHTTPPLNPPSSLLPRHFDARILVVEDDPVNQRVITLMLQRLGLKSEVAPEGTAALGAIETGKWDLVLMDCQLPGIDGLETTRRARQLPAGRSLPIVALTANARPEDRTACLAAGMDDFLAKPLRAEALQTCIARWLHPVT